MLSVSESPDCQSSKLMIFWGGMAAEPTRFTERPAQKTNIFICGEEMLMN
jgi:hypothetical protein